jgi:hypothetical protein
MPRARKADRNTMSVEPILSRLTTLYPVAIDLSLDRMRRLLDDLGPRTVWRR